MTPTDAILDFASAAHDLPLHVRANAERLLADTLAVGAAGTTAPGANAILQTARSFGAGSDARLLGSNERLPAASAAFVNAFRIHCLEWDAVHEPAVVHAMSVVTAALGAAVDRRGGCDPEHVLTALCVGVDIACGLGIACDEGLRFFRPATAGVIGAAVAVARLDGAPMADTLGLAYSQCAGTMQAHVEGSVALPFQVANAARAAVVAADLAKAGLTAPHAVLEGPFGYFTLIDRGDLSRYTNSLGANWQINEISTKPYPCGRASHAVLATICDMADFGDRVTALVPALVHRLVGRPMRSDMTPAYARLCLPFLIALMLRDKRIDPRQFTPATFADAELAAAAALVDVRIDGNPDPNALSPQTVFVDEQSIQIHHTLGSPAAPMSPAERIAKYDLCRAIAGDCDARIFGDPLSYATQPYVTQDLIRGPASFDNIAEEKLDPGSSSG